MKVSPFLLYQEKQNYLCQPREGNKDEATSSHLPLAILCICLPSIFCLRNSKFFSFYLATDLYKPIVLLLRCYVSPSCKYLFELLRVVLFDTELHGNTFYPITTLLPDISVDKGCQSHQRLQPPLTIKGDRVSPEGTQEE